MADETNNFHLPYPEGDDPVVVHGDIENLATSVDAALQAISTSVVTVEQGTTEIIERVEREVIRLEEEINIAGLPNLEEIMTDLENARTTLAEAQREFADGQAELGNKMNILENEKMPELIEALEKAEKTIEDAVNDAQKGLQALEERTSTAEESLSQAREDISEAKQILEPLPGRIEAAEQDVESARDEAAKASAAAVEANNRSMTRLANGGFELGLQYWRPVLTPEEDPSGYYSGYELTDDAYVGEQAVHSVGDYYGMFATEAAFEVEPGQIWEVSGYFKNAADGTQGGGALSLVDSSDLFTNLGAVQIETSDVWELARTRITIGEYATSIHVAVMVYSGAVVDSVSLRDVTDVVRLEQSAREATKKAENAQAKADFLELTVEGEGGLKDRLDSAETTLTEKADQSQLPELEQRLQDVFSNQLGDLQHLVGSRGRVWQQDTPPPAGTHYAWLGEPHRSVSVRFDGDGNETARNPRPLSSVSYADDYDETRVAQSSLRSTRNMVSEDNVPLEAGKDYLLIVYMKAYDEGAQGRVNFYIRETGKSAYGDWTDLTPGEWTRLEVEVDASYHEGNPLGTHAYIRDQDSSDSPFWITDRRLVPDPEPGVKYDYFDGDTPPDRANDLWINGEGTPHHWVKGQGWQPIQDQAVLQAIEDAKNTAVDEATTAAAQDAQEKADQARIDAEEAANAHADLVAQGASDEAIAEAERLHGLAIARAEKAEQDATDAHDAAGEAQGTADAAMNRANAVKGEAEEYADNLPKVLHGTTAPAGTAPNGSIWWQHQGALSGPVVGQWNMVNGSWQSTPIDSEAIANLDVGKLTAGSAEIAEAVVNKLWADMGIFNELQAEQGWIGGANLADGVVTAEKIEASREMITKILGADYAYVAEQLVVEGDLIADHADIISAAIENLDVTEQSNFNDAFANKLQADEFAARVATLSRAIVASQNLIPNWSQIQQGLPEGFEAWAYNPNDLSFYANSSGRRDMSTRFALDAGETYMLTVDVRSTVDGNRFHIPLRTEAGHDQFILSWESPGTEFTRFEAQFTVDETRDDYFLAIQALEDEDTGFQWFRNLSIKNMAEGNLIVEDSITSDKLLADSIGAREVNVEELFANEAVINQIYSNVVETELLEAGRAVIGGALIEKEAITVDKLRALDTILAEMLKVRKIEAGDIAANAITADKIDGKAIDGKTITGARVRTSASGARVEMRNDRLDAYNSSGTVVARYGADGISLRPPGGSLTSIGNHIFGSVFLESSDRSFSSSPGNSYTSWTYGPGVIGQFTPPGRDIRVDLSMQPILSLRTGANMNMGFQIALEVGGHRYSTQTFHMNNWPPNTSFYMSKSYIMRIGPALVGRSRNIRIGIRYRAMNFSLNEISVLLTPA